LTIPQKLEIITGLENCEKSRRTYKGKAIPGPDGPSEFQEVEAPRISRQSAHEGGKVVIPTHRPSSPPGKIPGTHFC
jgi:hypothetical protein